MQEVYCCIKIVGFLWSAKLVINLARNGGGKKAADSAFVNDILINSYVSKLPAQQREGL